MKRLLSILLAFLLFASDAHAGTLRRCLTLDAKTSQASSANGAIVEFAPVAFDSLSIIGTAANVSGTNPTMDLKVQSCRDSVDTTTCRDWQSFTQCTTGSCWTVGSQVIDINRETVNWFKYFRVVSTLGGTSPVYNYAVEMCHDGK